jgi:hypothetical protein
MRNVGNSIYTKLVLNINETINYFFIVLFSKDKKNKNSLLGIAGLSGTTFSSTYKIFELKSNNYINSLHSPMDQFEIQPFLGNFLGLNYTPLGLITNILIYISLVVTFILFFFIYGGFKNNIKING